MVEVGARDGLQNEPVDVATVDKVELVRRGLAAGLRRFEVASFVSPKRVPRMADAEAVVAALPAVDGASYIGLVLNARGAERALATNVHELGAVMVASDTFGQKNQGQTMAEGIAVASEIVKMARAAGRKGQVTISATFGCPFEGRVPPERILDIVKRLADAEPVELALADTIGVAVPTQVEDLVARVREAVPHMALRAHFHNTRNTGVANAWAAVRAGISTLDASLGGTGGCPFAPRATGNVATEDVVYMLQQSGVDTGVDLDALIEAAVWLEGILGRPVPSLVSKAGGFPASRAT